MGRGPLRASVATRLAATLPGPVATRETHGAWVLLAGDRAWKIRKAVRLAFLDYSTVERRLAAAREEVRLNEPLAPGVYLGVRALVERAETLELGPWSERDDAVDYAVEMRRFDEGRTMAALAGAGRLTAEQVDAVATRIAAFHAAAEHCPGPGAAPWAARVSADLDELAKLAHGRDDVPIAALRRFADGALPRFAAQLDRRAEHGLRRDGHGDLRAAHVVLGDELWIVDRLEFDRELRCADVAADLAFLLMDLEAHGAQWAAEELVRGYVRAGGDAGPRRLRALLSWQRAIVRAKVALLRGDEEEMRSRLALADLLAWRARAPAMLLVAGPPASGKSTLATELGQRFGLPVVSTDRVRKEMCGVAATDRLDPAAYTESFTREVYARAAAEAACAVADHGGVIVDATARTRELRALLTAELSGAEPIVAAVCSAAPSVLRARSERRLADPARVSDADGDIAIALAETFEPVAADEPRIDLSVTVATDDSARDPLDALAAALDQA